MLERLKDQVSPYLKARCWYVAYSGGLDSHVLLHALVALAKQDPHFPPVIALHINHQIQSPANAWELHCQHQAESLGVQYLSWRVNVDKTSNIEEQAREARYQVFSGILKENDCIFFAHHQQDQIETFFYRLFRGSGVKGLQAIPAERPLGKGKLVRPFLQFERAALEYYALTHELDYVNDPSNADIAYDRNFIRHQVLPVAQRRWPAFKDVVERVIAHLQDAGDLLDEMAIEDLSKCAVEGGLYPSLELQQLGSYSEKRKRNLLRYWLSIHHIVLSSQQTNELISAVINAKQDANPLLTIGNVCLRRYRQRLFIIPKLAGTFSDIHWNGLLHCYIEGYGEIALSTPLDIELLVKQRVGGETIKPVGSTHTRKLKVLLQEMDIPPWQRERMPLIYHDGELIAIADLIEGQRAEVCLQGRKIIRAKS